MQSASEHLLIEILSDIRKKLETMSAASRVWMTPDQLALYLGLSVQTIYQYVSNRKIPFYKIPGSSKLLFHKQEVDGWICGNQKCKDRVSDAKKVADEIWEQV